MSKKITPIIVLFFSAIVVGQNLSEKDILKLNKLQVNTQNFDLKNSKVQQDLNAILKLESKRKTNKTIAISLTTVSIATIIVGGILISKGDAPNSKDNLATPIGIIFTAGGVLEAGISIPFWVFTHKRKKQRDKMIQLFNK